MRSKSITFRADLLAIENLDKLEAAYVPPTEAGEIAKIESIRSRVIRKALQEAVARLPKGGNKK